MQADPIRSRVLPPEYLPIPSRPQAGTPSAEGHPVEAPGDEVVLTRRYLRSEERGDRLVGCEVNGEPLPGDPTTRGPGGEPRPVDSPPPDASHSKVVDVTSTFSRVSDGWELQDQVTTVQDPTGNLVSVRHDRRTGALFTEEMAVHPADDEDEQRTAAVRGLDVPEFELTRAREQTVEQALAHDDALEARRTELDLRFGEMRDAHILEIGPFTTTLVPRTLLKPGSGNEYTAVDVNEAALSVGRAALDHVGGYPAEHTRQVVGNLFHLDVPDASQDLVVAFASFPTNARSRDVRDAVDELDRVLKPGGQFMMSGMPLDTCAPSALAHMLDRFDIVGGMPDLASGTVLRKHE